MNTVRILFVLAAMFFAQDALAAQSAKKNATPKPKAKISLRTQLKKQLYADFDKREIDAIFADKRLEVYKPIVTSGGGPLCTYFDPCFGLLSDRALTTGFDFWSRNQEHFLKAKEIYGVDADVILGILRIETYFGKGNMGRRGVFNTLYALYVSSAKKRKFALAEMKSFIRAARRNGWDIFAVNGSSAGAFGIPQFIPSSYLNPNLVADGDGDDAIDLFNEADAVMSVAKYLNRNGWGDGPDQKKNAVLAYNHSSSYANAVLLYARVVGLLGPYKLEKPPTP